MVELFLKRFPLDDLNQGIPPPWIVACWSGNDATLDLLLERLPKEEIQRPGPDGLKPITILAKLGKWTTIAKFQDKFGNDDVTESHIANNKQDLFESRLFGSEPESWVCLLYTSPSPRD